MSWKGPGDAVATAANAATDSTIWLARRTLRTTSHATVAATKKTKTIQRSASLGSSPSSVAP